MQKKIVRDYYEQLHTNKLELEEILETTYWDWSMKK